VSNTDQPAVQPDRAWTHTGLEPEPVAAMPAAPAQPQYVYPPARPTSGMAITAFVLSLLGGAILAVIFGHIALNDINKTGKDGKGLAIAGLVIGYIQCAIWTLIIILMAAAAGA
jgi:Domain of unknown function (DUF4190)